MRQVVERFGDGSEGNYPLHCALYDISLRLREETIAKIYRSPDDSIAAPTEGKGPTLLEGIKSLQKDLDQLIAQYRENAPDKESSGPSSSSAGSSAIEADALPLEKGVLYRLLFTREYLEKLRGMVQNNEIPSLQGQDKTEALLKRLIDCWLLGTSSERTLGKRR